MATEDNTTTMTETPAQPTEATTDEMLSEQDRFTLDLAKTKLQLAVSQGDVAKLSYSNFLLQLARKYNLGDQDQITEEGKIVRQ